METYLSDAFTQTVLRDSECIEKLLLTTPEFKNKSYSLAEVVDWHKHTRTKVQNKAVLSTLIGGDSPEAVAAGIRDLSDEDYNKLADLLVDVLTLAEVAAQARMDGEIDAEETEAVFDSIDELRQEAEAVLTPF